MPCFVSIDRRWIEEEIRESCRRAYLRREAFLRVREPRASRGRRHPARRCALPAAERERPRKDPQRVSRSRPCFHPARGRMRNELLALKDYLPVTRTMITQVACDCQMNPGLFSRGKKTSRKPRRVAASCSSPDDKGVCKGCDGVTECAETRLQHSKRSL